MSLNARRKIILIELSDIYIKKCYDRKELIDFLFHLMARTYYLLYRIVMGYVT